MKRKQRVCAEDFTKFILATYFFCHENDNFNDYIAHLAPGFI